MSDNVASRTTVPMTYRFGIVFFLTAVVVLQNLGQDYLIALERCVMNAPRWSDPRGGLDVEIGWPIPVLYIGLETLKLEADVSTEASRQMLCAAANFAVGGWLVYAAYGYLCECYLMLGWRLNATILVSVAVILFSLFVEIQDRFEYYNGAGAVCGAIVRLSDLVMPALLFCGFLQLFEKLSQGWSWLLAKRS